MCLGRFRIDCERLPKRTARPGYVACVEKQIRRSKVESDVGLFWEFLELFLGALDTFFASRLFTQYDKSVGIFRRLFEDFERFFSGVVDTPRGRIRTSQMYAILNVTRVQLARLCQKCAGPNRCPIVQPHFSDPLECKSILWIELHHVEVTHLRFVVIAGLEVIIGLGEKACLLAFLRATSGQRNR